MTRRRFVHAHRHAGGLVRRLAIAFALLVAAWLAGLFWFAAQIPAPGPVAKRQTDAIVVLTGGTGRLIAGLALLSEGRAKKLFVSGVYRGIDVAALLRLARQAPREVECCIILGYAADNTVGNARETAAWMRKEGYTSLRLVTASYHMPRSLLEFRRVMGDITIIANPVHPERFRLAQWWRWPGTAGLIVSEFNKYLLALIRLSDGF
jgi:uncharacterized SAM-binding protein YcdF (DUF218 family)